MKASVWGLLIAAIAFGAGTIYLSMELNEERAQADKVAETMAALNARIAELEKMREQRLAVRGAFGGEALAPGGVVSAMPMGPPPTPVGGQANVKFAEAVSVVAPPPRSEAFEKMMRTNLRANNKRMYADIGEELGLSKEDTSRLIDMITDQQVGNFGAARELSVTDPVERRRLVEEGYRESQTEIETFLGPSKTAALRDYQETIPARMEVEQIARQLEGADATLSDEQQKRLVAALAEERKRIPTPQFANSVTPEDYSKAYAEWQADYSERANAQVRNILNTEQMNAYSDYQQWQKEMQAQMPMPRAGRGQRLPGGNVTFSAATMPFAAEGAVIVAAPPEEKPRKAQ
jgi:outer membrane murein-binding lipoprotein Lpp